MVGGSVGFLLVRFWWDVKGLVVQSVLACWILARCEGLVVQLLSYLFGHY